MTNVDLHKQIITEDNIKDAYLEVYENFITKCKVFDYDVVDGQQIHETELDLKRFLKEIREEMIEMKPLRMAQSISIPKKNGKLRKIYMVPIRERVKCQAIYRVMQEFVKPTYSKYLYSFRSERPSYYALRSLRRFYLANLNKGYYLLKSDFKDYSDHINKKILLEKLADMGVDENTLKLVRQFVEISFVRKGEWMSMAEGTMQGIPLVSLFNNIYMDQVDKKLGDESEFYRRVGDDVIVLDRNEGKLKDDLGFIRDEVKKMKIILNEDKTLRQPMEGYFEYLGLAFENGNVFIPRSSVDKMIDQLKLVFKPNSRMGMMKKLQRIKLVLAINASGQSAIFHNYAMSYNLMTDHEQLRKLSIRIMSILWAYLGGGYTAKKMAAGKRMMFKSRIKIMSFFDHFAEKIYPGMVEKPVKWWQFKWK